MPAAEPLSVPVQAATVARHIVPRHEPPHTVSLTTPLRCAPALASLLLLAACNFAPTSQASLAADVALTYIGLRACQAQRSVFDADAASQQKSAALTRDKVRVGFESPANGALADSAAADAGSRANAQRADGHRRHRRSDHLHLPQPAGRAGRLHLCRRPGAVVRAALAQAISGAAWGHGVMAIPVRPEPVEGLPAHPIRRRSFCAFAAATAAWPLRAQEPALNSPTP